MRLSTIPLFLLPSIALSQTITSPPTTQPTDQPLSIQTAHPNLELRQAAVPVAQAAPQPNNAAPAAPVVAAPVGGGAAAPVNAPAAANPAPVAANPAAPAAGQPVTVAAGQPNPVTTVMVNTIVGGVSKQIPVAFTQTFANSLTAVDAAQSGSVGMGTLTGSVGVVKSSAAKAGVTGRGKGLGWGVTLLMGLVGMGAGLARVFVL